MKPDDPHIIVKGDPKLLAREAATLFMRTAIEKVTTRNLFTVAISGGTTPGRMYALLAREPFCSTVPWDNIHIFWVDERVVPRSHAYSNYGQAEKAFMRKIPIPESNIHPMPVDCSPETGAGRYQGILRTFFDLKTGQFPRFDLIMLGVGKDGHTASLFPGQPALDEKERLVVPVTGGDPLVDRLTLTLPVLNNAEKIIFLVSGQDKADTMKAILAHEPIQLPARRVRPVKGRLKWLMDREAASGLPQVGTHEKS